MPPKGFQAFAAQQKRGDWNAVYQQQGLLAEVHDALWQEQEGLSGYTEKPLSGRVHADHFRKRSLFGSKADVFDWNNLIADDQTEHYGAKAKDKFVRTKEQNGLLINPVAEDPHEYLTYTSNGRMRARDGLTDQQQAKADYTIEAFNLNDHVLVECRNMIIQQIKQMAQLSDQDLVATMAGVGFPSVVEYAISVRNILK